MSQQTPGEGPARGSGGGSSSSWVVTTQAVDAYRAAAEHDPPTRAAFDRLWGRIALDPAGEGVPLGETPPSPDAGHRRIVKAIGRLRLPRGVELRVSYEPIEGPATPPWLAFSVHVADWSPWGEAGLHTLVAMHHVSRNGRLGP